MIDTLDTIVAAVDSVTVVIQDPVIMDPITPWYVAVSYTHLTLPTKA